MEHHVGELVENTLAEESIDIFENAQDPRQMMDLGVRILDDRRDYDPVKIAHYAIERGFASRLGYLADCAVKASEKFKVGNRERVQKLRDLLLENREEGYRFLFPYSKDDFGERMRKRASTNRRTIDEKWKVYAGAGDFSIDDYVKLYLVDLRRNERNN
jgi:hypothetical protein